MCWTCVTNRAVALLCTVAVWRKSWRRPDGFHRGYLIVPMIHHEVVMMEEIRSLEFGCKRFRLRRYVEYNMEGGGTAEL